MLKYLLNFCISFDQWVNSIFGANNPDETISSSVGRKAKAGRYRYIVIEATINWWFALLGQRHHCDKSIGS